MKVSDIGIKLITHYEGLHDGDLSKIGLQPKMDPVDIWTIGWGHALRDINGNWLKGFEGFKRLTEIYPNYLDITKEEADDLLKEDLVKFEKKVNSKLKVELNQHQFDALVSHTYNTGGSSTLFQLINQSPENYDEIADWWTNRYVTSGGKFLRGLKFRRETEFILYKTGELKFQKV